MMDVFNEDGWRLTDKYVFFYNGSFSNFARCDFEWTYDGETHRFFCTEQAFMWAKAKLFKDETMQKAILTEQNDPLECKHCGRWVQNYDDGEWSKVRFQIMKDVNTAKYTQDKLMNFKLTDPSFNNKLFVEASPTDRIWGVGIAIGNDKILNEKNWKGTNLLGRALTEVRREILKQS